MRWLLGMANGLMLTAEVLNEDSLFLTELFFKPESKFKLGFSTVTSPKSSSRYRGT